MDRSSLALALGCTLILGFATAACTVMSGVDEMELRTTANSASPEPAAAADAALPNPFLPDAGVPGFFDTSSGNPTPPTPPTPDTGPATCGAEGSWRTCDATGSVTTCAIQCAQQGYTCVESCCVTDSLGDYSSAVGMVYALASECSAKSIPSNATFGTCAETTAFPASLVGPVRCCCK